MEISIDAPPQAVIDANDLSPLLSSVALIASVESGPSGAVTAIHALAQNAADANPRTVLSAVDFIEAVDVVLARSPPEAIRDACAHAGA